MVSNRQQLLIMGYWMVYPPLSSKMEWKMPALRAWKFYRKSSIFLWISHIFQAEKNTQLTGDLEHQFSMKQKMAISIFGGHQYQWGYLKTRIYQETIGEWQYVKIWGNASWNQGIWVIIPDKAIWNIMEDGGLRIYTTNEKLHQPKRTEHSKVESPKPPE